MNGLPPLVRDPRKVDADHLKLLSIFHFIGCSLGLLGILFLLGHYALFSTIFSNPKMWENQRQAPPPPQLFAMLKWMYLVLGCWVLTSVILNLVYYTCPMLCNLVLNAQTAALRDIPWMPGEEFEVVTISIDPREMFDLAQKKRAVYHSDYGRPAPGWHFLSDFEGHSKQLAAQVGFKYRWDEKQEQFAHPAVIMILTPDGKISRYLYGIKFKPRDIRLALTEAAAGKWSQTLDRILLFCYHYDPQARSYTMFATNIMRGGGILTVFFLSFFIWRMLRREKVRAMNSRPPAPPAVSDKGMVPAK